ncbi:MULTISPECIES: YopJ/AvrA family T3SS effector serine/threonine acetyltransferase [unclassified Bartonella]|uniref:YopJ/AvrA family T3SS effector serine/threonine acetyltransferase n=1 Tax=unclassified Bartonella TaxID=2645622 RepID=UPI00099AB3E0|nr:MULTISPECIES: YopJ/AvrA family T3SS effector serine/threonine acetyltransferase [unclassified Bartonella]AQX27539.1 YopJ protease family [Bartonella sp. JB15]AQX28819.1 YopJ protease family [Bartonella sp. JB63]
MWNLLSTIKNAIGLPNTKTEDECDFSSTSLENIITALEDDIESNRFYNTEYARIDFKMMPALVKQANNKYPEMNLTLIKEPIDFVSPFKKTIKKGIQSSRYMINVGANNQFHFGVVDHQTLNNKISLILFEPVSFNLIKPALLGAKMQTIIETRLPSSIYFSMVEMNIQRSMSECGIFSLSLAKKLYLQSDKLKKLHIDNIEGKWDRSTRLSHDVLDKYLPVSFYKHTQSLRRLETYVQKNPGSENEIVNKKNETIFERFEKNLVTLPWLNKNISASAHRKRVSEYKSLIR